MVLAVDASYPGIFGILLCVRGSHRTATVATKISLVMIGLHSIPHPQPKSAGAPAPATRSRRSFRIYPKTAQNHRAWLGHLRFPIALNTHRTDRGFYTSVHDRVTAGLTAASAGMVV